MRVSIKILEGCLFGVLGGVVFWVCLFVVVVCFIYCLFAWGYFFFFFAHGKVSYLQVRYILPMKKSCT